MRWVGAQGRCSIPRRAWDQGRPASERCPAPGVSTAEAEKPWTGVTVKSDIYPLYSSIHPSIHPSIQASVRVSLGNPDLREDAVTIHLVMLSIYLF